MLAEAITKLAELAVKTVRAEVKPYPNDPDSALVIAADGTWEQIAASRPRQVVTVFSNVREFADYLRDVDWTEPLYVRCESGLIRVDTSDWQTGREDMSRVLHLALPVPLKVAAILERVDCETPRYSTQAELIKMLRFIFHDTISPAVVATFRTLNLETVRKVRSNLAHGRASLDSEVRASVAPEEADVPLSFRCNFDLFEPETGLTGSHAIDVGIDIDTDKGLIGVMLLPGPDVYSIRQAYVVTMLRELVEVPVYAGKRTINVLKTE